MDKKETKNIIRVVELFAGVGGFRLGLEKASTKNLKYKIVWGNQWEPKTKVQHASDIYVKRFGQDNYSNEDINLVIKNKFNEIKDHDLLVGGFPCQDYSVARTLNHAKGLYGKKGVLWWSIINIIKGKKKKSPNFLLFENVDRLLKSPSQQRGRDFAVMLASLSDLGYIVEWRVINASEYGFPQRRKRVFILGYKKGSSIYKKIKKTKEKNWILKNGVLAQAFPVKRKDISFSEEIELKGSLSEVSENFSKEKPIKSVFNLAGIMMNRKFITAKVYSNYNGKNVLLKDVILKEKHVPQEFFLEDKDWEKWAYLKNSKKEKRESKSGFKYIYSEGSMTFPDDLNKPSRTIVTGEGGRSPSRFKHVIKTKSGRLRRLIPLELERLNMFPDNHTKGISNTKRAFIMGNALVVGVIERIGKSLIRHIK